MAVTVKLMGGMGNQMFQAAMGMAQAARLGTSVQLDPSLLTNPERKFALGQWSMYLDLGVKPTTIHEQGMLYNQKLVDSIKDGDCLQGYWQSEKYFANLIPDAIHQVFTPFAPLSDRAKRVQEHIEQNENMCFVHVRRGDYLKEPHKSFHGVLGMSYYSRAASEIFERTNGSVKRFVVFTDDPEWARTQFTNPFYTVIEPNRESEDIYLMSLCKHAIIANSSFSWFGAWLGDNKKNRTVIAPQKWFTDEAKQDYSDIVPGRWIKI